MKKKTLGRIKRYSGPREVVNISCALMVLGAAAVGTYVGFRIGGPHGAAVGSFVGSFIGALEVGMIRKARVIINPDGRVVLEYETYSAVAWAM